MIDFKNILRSIFDKWPDQNSQIYVELNINLKSKAIAIPTMHFTRDGVFLLNEPIGVANLSDKSHFITELKAAILRGNPKSEVRDYRDLDNISYKALLKLLGFKSSAQFSREGTILNLNKTEEYWTISFMERYNSRSWIHSNKEEIKLGPNLD